nr:Chain C, 3BP-1 SYNTHETIC PEPTIDE, 10 RESIDUES [unidentified]1ABO_D Chain D, 3BP-1 SYNTHETIC PEPTIDE, 10 RESIDUES [unidentified]
APTMPPPLPP